MICGLTTRRPEPAQCLASDEPPSAYLYVLQIPAPHLVISRSGTARWAGPPRRPSMPAVRPPSRFYLAGCCSGSPLTTAERRQARPGRRTRVEHRMDADRARRVHRRQRQRRARRVRRPGRRLSPAELPRPPGQPVHPGPGAANLTQVASMPRLRQRRARLCPRCRRGGARVADGQAPAHVALTASTVLVHRPKPAWAPAQAWAAKPSHTITPCARPLA